MNVVTQLTQFVGRDVINKNTIDLAVYAIQLGQLSWVELCRYKHPFRDLVPEVDRDWLPVAPPFDTIPQRYFIVRYN